MPRGVVRIIGGAWRGRKLSVPDVAGLRPTPDRVRETVFNWLQSYLPGARCLDLFAGTGALGFESVSRGASYVQLVDASPVACAQLTQQAAVFRAEEKVVIQQTAVPAGLSVPSQPFDIVFIDPPYAANLAVTLCFYLEENGFLADSAYVYLEAERSLVSERLPVGWEIIKHARAGDVYYHLAKRNKQDK